MDMEGNIEFRWGKVWYYKTGKPKGLPLLVLHGGPGYPSDYLRNLEQLGSEREVIFYDQSGCGRSGRLSDPSLWTVEHFVQELEELRIKLKLDDCHLLGHSWGTILAAEYLYTKPLGVSSIVFASPCISIPLWLETTSRHLAELPQPLGKIILKYEADGKINSPEYKHAQHLYHITYECRIDPAPDGVKAANAGFGAGIYRHMWGPNEYTITGSLKNYDSSMRLREITQPALFTCGKFDSVSPQAAAYYQSQIPHAQLKVFENSSHMAHLEEEFLYIKILRQFLAQND
ncbi:MAG: proline iminopeptidase-family hydrolase [Patescibacteria group bacterium]|nr:proline iminopeptidase-family hydrolase [Patescibacteria group bacterium]